MSSERVANRDDHNDPTRDDVNTAKMTVYEIGVILSIEAESEDAAREVASDTFDDPEFNYRDHHGMFLRKRLADYNRS